MWGEDFIYRGIRLYPCWISDSGSMLDQFHECFFCCFEIEKQFEKEKADM